MGSAISRGLSSIALVLLMVASVAEAQAPAPLYRAAVAARIETSPALGDDGHFYAHGQLSSGDASIVALDPETGTLLWGPVIPAGCSRVFGQLGPSVGANGIVYATGDWNECGDGRLVALSAANGSVVWDHGDCPGGGNTSPHPRQTPALNDGLNSLHFGSTRLCSVDMTAGTNNWDVSGGFYIGAKGIAIDTADNVYVGTQSGAGGETEIRSFTSSGVLRWSRLFGTPSGPAILAVTGDNTVLLYDESANALLAWDGLGGDLWQFSNLSRPVLDAGGVIYASSVTGADVVALNPNGSERWRRTLPGAPSAAVDFVDNGGRVYARGGPVLFVLNTADGSIAWSFAADTTLLGGAVLAPGGRIFLADANRNVYLLDTSLNYAASSWPKALYGNRRHTQKAGDVLELPGTSPPPNPVMSLSKPSLDFGLIATNVVKDLSFTVTNTGGGTLAATAAATAPFSVVSGANISLAAGASSSVTVRLFSATEGIFNQGLSIAGNVNSISLPLKGVVGTAVVPLPTATWTTPPPSSVTVGQTFTVAWTTAGSPTHVNVHWNPTDPLGAGCCLGAADTTNTSTVSPTSSPVTLTAPSKNADGTQIISPTTVKYVVHVSNSAGSGNSTVVSITVNPAVSGPLTVIITGTGSGRVTSKPNGIDCGSTCVADFGSRRTVQLIAEAEQDSLFIGWDQTRCTAKKPCAIILKETSQVEAKFIKRPNTTDPKIIYVAICGAGDLFQEACFEGKGWFDPRLEPAFGIFNPLNDSDLSSIATISSGLVSIGLKIGTLSPNSVILIASFSVGSAVVGRDLLGSNASIVTDFITALYNAGDKIYLVGHSYGGKITNETAQNLRRKKIPVQVTAYIDAFPVFSAKVPDNVTRALNFFYPNDTEPRCPISGDSKIEAQKPSATEITNTPIPRPEGPGEAFLVSCNPHTNMDNDPDVWRPILNYILQTIP